MSGPVEAGFRLHPDDVALVAARVAEVLRAQAGGVSPVLTTREVMALTGRQSAPALHRWVARWAPRASCGRGRYNRAVVLRGLEREAAGRVAA
jgi:hypothetical protein